MNSITLRNGRKLNNPSFFTISNLGGGGSDKYRESVYKNLYTKIPTLYNYYYLKNHKYARQELARIKEFTTFHDLILFVQNEFIKKKFFYNLIEIPNTSINEIILLDTGGRNLINDIIKSNKGIDSIDFWVEKLSKVAIEYYQFAEEYQFDIVIGFDIGGKYTFKDKEKTDEQLVKSIEFIESNAYNINSALAEVTIKFLKENPQYSPSIYMPVHGKIKSYLYKEIENIQNLEKEYDYRFFGIAIGGIASSKGVDEEWFIEKGNQRNLNNAYVASKVTKIVHSKFPDRPIHVLGAGGIRNIVPVSLAGATSFDSQTPGRRAYDGNALSTKYVFNTEAKGSFSKYLPGLLTHNLEEINIDQDYDYTAINKVDDAIELCGCPACLQIDNFKEIKKLYSQKESDTEAYYFSRQLLNAHAIYQHKYLSDLVSRYRADMYENNFQNENLKSIVNFSKRILEE